MPWMTCGLHPAKNEEQNTENKELKHHRAILLFFALCSLFLHRR